jgi:hypothetical protein
MELKENHIIIGLGGTGGNIIKAFRKRIFSEFSFEERRKLPIGFVYMDSSDSMMKPDDQTWKILGENAQLGKNSQVFIGDANLKDQLNNIDRHPGIKGWIGNKKLWDNIASNIVKGAAAAQRRRVGRFLFSSMASKFLSTIQNQVEEVQKKTGLVEVTFHIFTGLAGGTGSGSIIDVITQIRNKYRDSTKEKIFVYTFLPEKGPKEGWNKGYYHANGYAALMELNALSVGQFKPHDVAGQIDRIEDDSFFNGCYLFSNVNENGIKVDIENQLPSIVADFLFQKIMLTPGSISKIEFDKDENFENSTDEKYELDKLEDKKRLRSRMFLSFGIKRVEIPEEEIIEFITYNFSRQALLQFNYNHWTEFGYDDSPQEIAYVSYVKDENTLRNWYLSDDHITLSLPILKSDETQKWKTIVSDWNGIMPTLKSTAWENPNDKTTPINLLSKFCEERFDKNFRRVGVVEFYRNNRHAKTDIAKEIVARIERNLFNDWRVGSFSYGDGKIPCSVYHIVKIVENLIKQTEFRLVAISTRINQLSEEIERLITSKLENEVAWSKISTLEGFLGKRDRVFEAHGTILQSLFTKKTEQEARMFAKELLAEVLNQLQILNGEALKFSDKISKMVSDTEKMISARCQDKQLEPDSFKDAIVRYYDVSKVKEFTKNILKNQDIQQNLSSILRNKITEPIGIEPTFSKFNAKISQTFLIDTLENTCKERAITEHNAIIKNKNNRLIKISIIDKLYEQYGKDPDGLKSFLRPLAQYGGTFIHFNDGEIQSDGLEIGVKIKLGRTIVILPKSDDDRKDFIDDLKDAFKEVFSETILFDDKSEKQNEICVMKITYCFPLRGVKEVEMLKKEYGKLFMREDKDIAGLVLHMEGDGTQFQKLFLPSTEEKEAEKQKNIDALLPYYLIAKAMNIIIYEKDERTGKKAYGINKNDPKGRKVGMLEVGPKMIDILLSYNEEIEKEITTTTKEKLTAEYRHIDKRKEIESGITDVLNLIILKECNNNTKSSIYERFLAASNIAYNLIED